jgi:hypothetical protein
MQVLHMQLVTKNWTPVLPIGSFVNGLLRACQRFLLGSKMAGAFSGPLV